MVLKMYSIYDKKTEIFHPPMYAHNNAHAMRVMAQEIKQKGSTINEYPDDFTLNQVGEFNDENAVVKKSQPIELVCECRDLVPSPEETNAR